MTQHCPNSLHIARNGPPSAKESAREIHILMNNNAQDYAIQNARQLTRLLSDSLSTVEVVAAGDDQ